MRPQPGSAWHFLRRNLSDRLLTADPERLHEIVLSSSTFRIEQQKTRIRRPKWRLLPIILELERPRSASGRSGTIACESRFQICESWRSNRSGRIGLTNRKHDSSSFHRIHLDPALKLFIAFSLCEYTSNGIAGAVVARSCPARRTAEIISRSRHASPRSPKGAVARSAIRNDTSRQSANCNSRGKRAQNRNLIVVSTRAYYEAACNHCPSRTP